MIESIGGLLHIKQAFTFSSNEAGVILTASKPKRWGCMQSCVHEKTSTKCVNRCVHMYVYVKYAPPVAAVRSRQGPAYVFEGSGDVNARFFQFK